MNLKTYSGGIEMSKDQVVTAPCAGCGKHVVASSRRVPALRTIEDSLGREAEVADVEPLGLCVDCAEIAEGEGLRLHNVEATKKLLAARSEERALEESARRERVARMNTYLARFVPASRPREVLAPAKVVGRLGENPAVPKTPRGRRREEAA